MKIKWKNGDKCIYNGEDWQFVSILSEEFHGTAVIFDESTEDLIQVALSTITKPETTQQREERERLEAAYDLYLTQCLAGMCDRFTYEEFIKEKFLVKIWLQIVDKTNYRK